MAVGEYALTSLRNVKDYYGKSGSDVNDDRLLELLINKYSVLFETKIDKNIVSREYTEYLDGRGLSVLFPIQYPIISISGIWDSFAWTWDDSTLIAATNYRIADNNRIVFKNTILSDNVQNVKMVYTAGYATVPEDLELACINEVVRAYKRRKENDVQSKSLSDGSVSYVSTDFLKQTKVVLYKYGFKGAF